MNRREAVLALSTLAALGPRVALPQTPAKSPTIGYLGLFPLRIQVVWDQALKDLGWVEGKNVVVDRVFANGNPDKLPALAGELVRKRVDAIFALGPEAAVTAAQATKSIPIVFWGPAFPVEQGLVDSFARPGRNLTGVVWNSAFDKHVEFIKQVAPRARRVAFFRTLTALRTLTGGAFAGTVAQIESTGRAMGLEMKSVEVTRQEDFAGAFKSIKAWGPQALIAYATPTTGQARQQIVDFANDSRMPLFSDSRLFVDAGGFFSHGPLTSEMTVQSVRQLDRILRGAQPASLPVEMPTRYETVVNQKTADRLGIKIPQALLARVDEVIR
jgi:putative tryptophan/tyrosine transport system substrate-binding protein